MGDAPLLCYHCGEPARSTLTVRLHGVDRPVCCPGCQAAVTLIDTLELGDFYRFREPPAPAEGPRPEPAAAGGFAAYDDAALLETLTRPAPRGREISLGIGGLTCAACSWLITRTLERTAGVLEVSVNTATGRARLVFDPAVVTLSRILTRLQTLGYRPQVLAAAPSEDASSIERRAALKRLAVAGLGMMQVMMFALPLYTGRALGMEQDVRVYFEIVSLLVATPVMLYAGWPYFLQAARALAARHIVMEVPVSLALLLAYGASVIDTVTGRGEVYFDSVTMFIFFMTLARVVEMIARHRSTAVSDSLARMLPPIAHRLPAGANAAADVPLALLRTGDRIEVRAGEVVPADGVLESGSGAFDESLLTGESLPVEKGRGDALTAGSINAGSPLIVRVTATGSATVLAGIVALLLRAQGERPQLARLADRFASRFLAAVLAIGALVAVGWALIDPARCFPATLAVLVVACPCAFSLATLVAVASAQAALARRGVLVARADALERLAHITRVVFDKTGTLTRGTLRLVGGVAHGEQPLAQCLAIAAALEASSEHPIARAFRSAAAAGRAPTTGGSGAPGPTGTPLATAPAAQRLEVVAGGGLRGLVEGRCYRLGQRTFVLGPQAVPLGSPQEDAELWLALEEPTGARRALASFRIEDALRPEAPRVMGELRALGLEGEILSGDAAVAVGRVARACAIDAVSARCSPAQKLERVHALTARGEFIAMVGDGINDAPVLGGAGVSIAMSRGAALALASADIVLIGDSLEALPQAVATARRTLAVIRQNLVWAAGYNLVCMPLAALGRIPPWLAALGMSASSILVVLNALRLMRAPRSSSPPAARPAAMPLHPPALEGSAS